MATKKTIDSKFIIDVYMHHVLEESEKPTSVYKFCKTHKIEEQQFYAYFGSFEALEKSIWELFFDNTMSLAEKNPDYTAFTSKEKLLTFFYTFFELLTANRSYVLFVLENEKENIKSLMQLSGLRKRVVSFAEALVIDDNAEKSYKISKRPEKIFAEAAWVQTLFILKFWLHDSSTSFEKTDLVIEKSVRVVFDVFDSSPIEGILDFGKFLWKEATV
ncbi:MAG: TetR family transcriptional regulator C-terminal domain-containing protein [Flavobacteriaceae bacterium]|nr:TetR family transcriptional regulator C-terminal domain-containing protein [Flavobacteriaceae bacterium]